MLALRLSKDIDKRREELARKTGRTREEIALEAVAQHLEDIEDALAAVARLEEDDFVRVPRASVIRDIEVLEARRRSPRLATD